MNLELKNVAITNILTPKTGVTKDGKEWKSIDFVVSQDTENNGKTYTKKCVINIFGAEKVDKFLTEFAVGDAVDVMANIDAQEYQGKFYNKIQAWKVTNQNAVPRTNISTANSSIPQKVVSEDLPF